MIADGSIVGWFQGRSELGPRALGNRSILADPRTSVSKRRLDAQVKHREWFRPYAPSVLEGFAAEYFDTSATSPFMLLVAPVRSENRTAIPAIIHEDGSARLQTVSIGDNPRYYELIESFRRITGIPLLLNTSFNSRGRPIVETPHNAIDCFKECPGIDALVMGDLLITRIQPQGGVTMISHQAYEYDLHEISIDQLHHLIRSDFSAQPLLARSKFRLVPEYAKWLRNGEKSTTVRYRPDAIDVPLSLTMPVLETGSDDKKLSMSDSDAGRVGMVRITNLTIKPFASLNSRDAHRDGFSSEKELKHALQSLYTPLYGPIRDDAFVSVYVISLVEGKE